MDIHTRTTEEITALHAALAKWLSGRVPRDAAFFEREFAVRFHDAFFNIQPAGVVLSRTNLLNALEQGHGASHAFDIRIRNVQVQQTMDDDRWILATYEEYQIGARNSTRANNARLSSVLFERQNADALIWRHIHETWLPEENHADAKFAFSRESS